MALAKMLHARTFLINSLPSWTLKHSLQTEKQHHHFGQKPWGILLLKQDQHFLNHPQFRFGLPRKETPPLLPPATTFTMKSSFFAQEIQSVFCPCPLVLHVCTAENSQAPSNSFPAVRDLHNLMTLPSPSLSLGSPRYLNPL